MRRRRQEVRQRSAKPPPPVQIRAAPPESLRKPASLCVHGAILRTQVFPVGCKSGCIAKCSVHKLLISVPYEIAANERSEVQEPPPLAKQVPDGAPRVLPGTDVETTPIRARANYCGLAAACGSGFGQHDIERSTSAPSPVAFTHACQREPERRLASHAEVNQ